MDAQSNLQALTLDLRKTDDGWQYLSEGAGTEPDQWCDATSVLGPFGGTGVNALLDELALVKAELAKAKQDATRFQFIVDCPIREVVAISRKASDPGFDLTTECDRLIVATGFTGNTAYA